MRRYLRWFTAFLIALSAGRPLCGAQLDRPPGSSLEEALSVAGIGRGVAVVLKAPGRADLSAIVASSMDFVHVWDPDMAAVERAREIARKDASYGRSLIIERGDWSHLPYANRMIDVMIAPGLTIDELKSVSRAELVRVLRPGGCAVLGGAVGEAKADSLSPQQLSKWWSDFGGASSEVTAGASGTWIRIVADPREGVDQWSHWEHGPDNNPVSHDTQIKAPYHTQWVERPIYITMPAITTSAGGRLFLAMGHIAHHRREEPWLNTLLARNAYNGTILWQRKLPAGYLVHRSAFIATEDAFYMISEDGTSCLVLDPETGLEKRRIEIPDIRGERWKWMVLKNGVMYVMAGRQADDVETTVVRSKLTHWSWGELSRGYYARRVPWGFGDVITAFDLEDNKTLWTHREPTPIDSRAMVMGGDRLFYYAPDTRLGCLDAGSGSQLWANDDPRLRELIEEAGRGLTSTPGFRSSCFSLFTPQAVVFQAQTRMNVVAVSPEDGKLLWHREKTTNNPNMLYTDELLYVGIGKQGNTLAVKPLTGETVKDLGFKKRSCARLTATPDSFFCRGFPEGLTRFDRKSGQVQFNGAFRPACNDGVMAANGMLYLGPWPCDCNLSMMGRVALISADQVSHDKTWADTLRLTKGEKPQAGSEILDVSDSDWATYRANPQRSASTKADIPNQLVQLWHYRPPATGKVSAPTTAGGMVFVGNQDGRVIALDAQTGRNKWSFATAGPVEQPPTLADGRALVGSGDGAVYALDAGSGRLIWRYRVAPMDRRMMVYGRLCSTWPVNSGVLVHDGVAYASAGIVDYDQTHVAALDVKTGKPRWINSETGHLDPVLRKGVSAQGILTISGDRIWMAGGNVVSPAAFDLTDGSYLSGSPGNGAPQSNRGEEVAVLNNSFVLQGGRLRYSADRNVVNPGAFVARRVREGARLGPPMPICSGKIAPAWDDRSFTVVLGVDRPPSCLAVAGLNTYLNGGDPKSPPPGKWTAMGLRGSDTVSLALANNAVVAVCSTPRPRQRRSNWRLVLIRRDTGQLRGQFPLPSEALPGALAIDREGRVLVVLQDGGIVCYGARRPSAQRSS